MRVPGVRSLAVVVVVAVLVADACSGGGKASSSPIRSATTTTVAPVTVGCITATIAPEADKLAKDAGVDLASEVRSDLARVSKLLRFDTPVDVRIVVNPAEAIPEVGVGGFTSHRTGWVTISLSPKAAVPPRESITVWLRQTLAHELDHSKRSSGAIPRWAGYTIGSAWVRDYLAAHPDVGVVAATLLPAGQIIPR